MKKLSAVALIWVFLAVPLAATPGDETSGQQSQIVASVPTGGFSCGRASYPIYCTNIPANIGGTFWLDVYTNAYPEPKGFILFSGVADLGQASITGATVTKNSLGQVTTLVVTFNGATNDGDNDSYSGSATFAFSYYKMSGGSGRGGGYPGYILILNSGSLAIKYS